MTHNQSMGGEGGIWCEIRFDEVSHVIDEYELWKDDAWCHQVNWPVVCAALAHVLQERARNGSVDCLLAELEPIKQEFSDVDLAGLASLVLEPITVTPVQLTNGGHRLAAMRRQDVVAVPGLFHRDDVGSSVDPERIYPVRDR